MTILRREVDWHRAQRLVENRQIAAENAHPPGGGFKCGKAESFGMGREKQPLGTLEEPRNLALSNLW